AVIDDAAADAPRVGVQAMAFGELEGVLAFEGISRVAALQPVQGVVQQPPQVGAALQVGEAQGLAAPDAQGPVGATGQVAAVEGFAEGGGVGHGRSSGFSGEGYFGGWRTG